MKASGKARGVGGLGGWLLKRLRSGARRTPRLELVERIVLAPRQSLALVEAEGRRFLVATSSEGAPVFYALDEALKPAQARLAAHRRSGPARAAARVSW